MKSGFVEPTFALLTFLGAHAVAGIPGWRSRLINRLGERTYRIVYSLLSLGLLTWVISAVLRAPYIGLWGPWPWADHLLIVLMAPACLLIAAAVLEPNPLSLSFARGAFNPSRPGLAGLVRHPLPMAFTLWSGGHFLANGDVAAIALFGGMFILSLAGPGIAAAKARRLYGTAQCIAWNAEMARAPRVRCLPRPGTVLLGLCLYGILLWLHGPVIGIDPLALLPG